MTRVGIMTFLHNDNYGSLLQAWALQTAIRSLGYAAEDIDYRPSRQEKLRNLLTSGNSPRLILEGIRKRRANSGSGADFNSFFDRAIFHSPTCRNAADLKKQAEHYDVIMCGSDQVWSPVWLNPAYFLNFTDRPKVAYACSLGVRELPQRRKQKRMAALMQPFSAVSVREEEGADILAQITGKRPVVMPDPVMLIQQEQWRTMAAAPKDAAPYLLCFFIGDQPAYWETVRAMAQETGLPVHVIPRTEAAYQSGYTLCACSPEQWLGLIEGAAHLITDSFHGAAFAAILNRPLTVLRRYREDDPESKNSRIDQLLRQLQLQQRNDAPDWNAVNDRIASIRQIGLEWLQQALDAAAQSVPAAAARSDAATRP